MRTLLEPTARGARNFASGVRPALAPAVLIALALLGAALAPARAAVTALADQPFLTTVVVPGNVALTLSVEYPTATSIGNGIVNYSSAKTYYGYFDPTKCYYYNQVTSKTGTTLGSYFTPAAVASTTDHSCAGATSSYYWAGNFLNWAAMSTIDPFRWALTGGYRAVDTATTTILEKSWAPPGQGGGTESPVQTTSQTTYGNITPFPSSSWSNIYTTVSNLGQYLCFTGSSSNVSSTAGKLGSVTYSVSTTNYSGTISGATEYQSGATVSASGIYCVETRVQVCNAAAATGVESNCTLYPSGDYKPEGLIQAYSQQMRFADFGYLLDSGVSSSVVVRDGGVMRARMEFVGPTAPVPGSSSITNPNAEWSASTGQFIANPDATDTAATLAVCSGCNIPNSGVINYLNNFGEHSRGLGRTVGYKSADNVSELYYTAIRYFKELGNVPEYTALTAINSDLANSDCVKDSKDQCVDGFPVITNWYPADTSAPRGYDFPIQYACQKNFILGIADANTHTDGNLPGSYGGGAYLSNANGDTTYEPPLESLVSSAGGVACAQPSITPCSDTTVDTTLVTNWIGAQEATYNGPTISNYNGQTIDGHTVSTSVGTYGPLGETALQNYLGCCGGATYYLAGLAYDAHVKDLLPNVFKVNGTKTQIQTLSTYFVDVLEYGTYYPQNQYWMAAKYGGFTVPTGYTEFTTPTATVTGYANPVNWATSMWASGARTVAQGTTNYLVPDHYYSGRDSAAMVSGLTSAFSAIAASVNATTTSLSLSSPQITSNGTTSYSAFYDPNNWTGDVQASTLTYDQYGNATLTQVWDGQSNLEAHVAADGFAANTGRIIVTWSSTVGDSATGAAVGFEAANLSATETTDLTATSSTATATQVVNYLRGDRSNEGLNGSALFRSRQYLLGDIVDSKVVAVGAPTSQLTAETNPGYSVFKSTYSTRNPVVYFGANDGMLHAFDGSTTGGTAGQELWAYVPGALYAGPTNTPYTNGLVSRTYKSFTHYNFVDATPVVGDVDFDNSGCATPFPCSPSASDWHTILVGGLGKGGMSYYAIDITNPAVMTSESAVAGKVLWEFSQKTITAYGSTATIGYSYGPAVITKTAKYGWVVILTSGFDNSNGIGYFFFVNPKTGALLEPPVSTGVGTATTPSGLAYSTTYVPDYTDGTSDALYAGDVLGNLWRVDLTPTTGHYAAPFLLATAKDASNNPQPITTWPIVEISNANSLRYVLFGTGRTLAFSDLSNTQINTIYSIYDGGPASGAFLTPTSPTLPTGATYPVTRTELTDVTSLLTGVGTNPSGKMGWYTDLGASTTAPYVAEQVDINPAADNGFAAFGINLTTGSPCVSPSGTGRIVAFDVGTGVTALTAGNGSTTAVATYNAPNRIEDVVFTNIGGSQVTLTVGTDYTPTQLVNPNFNPTISGTPNKLNWHEIKGAN